MTIELIDIGRSYFQQFLQEHPLDWLSKQSHLARLGAVGDLLSPTPVMRELFVFLKMRRRLFTIKEFGAYAQEIWADWRDELSEEQRRAFGVKLQKNFYNCGFMDSLDAWTLLASERCADICYLATEDDVCKDIDLRVIKGQKEIIVALCGIPTKYAMQTRERKKARRERRGVETHATEVWLPSDRRRGIGNRVWYRLDDFAQVLSALE